MSVGEWSDEVAFEVLPDPRSSATAEDYRAQFDFVIAVRDKVSDIHDAIGDIRELKRQVGDLEKRLEKREVATAVTEAAKALKEKLGAVEEVLYQTQMKSRQDPLNYPIRLNDKLAGLIRLGSFGDLRPTDSLEAVRSELSAAIDEQLAELSRLIAEDVAQFNRLVREHDVEAVIAP